MIFFSKSENGFFLSKIHGNKIPADAKEIGEKEYKDLLEKQSNGFIIQSDELGYPVALQREWLILPLEDLLYQCKSKIRSKRRDILDAVTGIGFRAVVLGDAVLAQEAARVSQMLLDITDDASLNAAQNIEEMESAVMAYYAAIVSTVSPELRVAFREFEK